MAAETPSSSDMASSSSQSSSASASASSDSSSRGVRTVLHVAVIVAALGYFVDIYDLVLFSIVRIPSLKALGLSGEELTNAGGMLLQVQMIGMLIGGIIWGVLGDRRGRLQILFGSILLYSIANIMNAFATSVEMYGIWRFIAGLGLAGELGAGITLVSEILHKDIRGIGTAIVASIGIAGAILANLIAKSFDWQTAYIIGGVMGLALLILRISVHESGLFDAVKTQSNIVRGAFHRLFTSSDRFRRYLLCTLIGLPTWYVVGILITFSKEFGEAMHFTSAVDPGNAIAFCYGGLVLGDLASGLLSQWLRSRRKALAVFLVLDLLAITAYFKLDGISADAFYWFCAALGFSVGFWAMFVTVAAEQFGTNFRATVATTVPNFARGVLAPMISVYTWLRVETGDMRFAALIVGVSTVLVALVAVWFLAETFHRDLDFVEATDGDPVTNDVLALSKSPNPER